jgi:hypothetical protein
VQWKPESGCPPKHWVHIYQAVFMGVSQCKRPRRFTFHEISHSLKPHYRGKLLRKGQISRHRSFPFLDALLSMGRRFVAGYNSSVPLAPTRTLVVFRTNRRWPSRSPHPTLQQFTGTCSHSALVALGSARPGQVEE